MRLITIRRKRPALRSVPARSWPQSDPAVAGQSGPQTRSLIEALLEGTKKPGDPHTIAGDDHDFIATEILCEATGRTTQPYWLTRDDFVTRFVCLFERPEDQAQLARIRWHEALTALNAGDLPCPPWAERVLRIAASTAIGAPVSLRDCLIPGVICAVTWTDSIRYDARGTS